MLTEVDPSLKTNKQNNKANWSLQKLLGVFSLLETTLGHGWLCPGWTGQCPSSWETQHQLCIHSTDTQREESRTLACLSIVLLRLCPFLTLAGF